MISRKASGCLEGLPRAEDEAAADDVEQTKEADPEGIGEARPSRQVAVEAKETTASDGPCLNRCHDIPDGVGRRQRVGIDKNEDLAAGFPRAAIPGRRDLPVVDVEHPRGML